MVGLKDKLIDILELRKNDFTGNDIKQVIECILSIEATERAEANTNINEDTQKLMKDWMMGGE